MHLRARFLEVKARGLHASRRVSNIYIRHFIVFFSLLLIRINYCSCWLQTTILANCPFHLKEMQDISSTQVRGMQTHKLYPNKTFREVLWATDQDVSKSVQCFLCIRPFWTTLLNKNSGTHLRTVANHPASETNACQKHIRLFSCDMRSFAHPKMLIDYKQTTPTKSKI